MIMLTACDWLYNCANLCHRVLQAKNKVHLAL